MGSFKLKLVVYFLLLALVPLGVASFGFGSVVRRSETRRVDAKLQGGLRAAVTAYDGEVAAAEGRAERLAAERFVSARITVGGRLERRAARPFRVQRVASAFAGKRLLGEVAVSVPLDGRFVRRIRRSAGIGADEMLVLLDRGRVAVGPAALVGKRVPQAAAAGPSVVSLAGKRYRTVVAGPLREPPGVGLAVLSAQSRIDHANQVALGRVFIGLLGALVLIGLLTYILSRSIVGALAEFARWANAIARGRFGERVPVRGRDEFAQLGLAFNEMAAQLEARVTELLAERRRVRQATLRLGDALSGTHDIDHLRRVLVETALQATGARGAELEADGQTIILGAPAEGPEKLELPLAAGGESFGTLILSGEGFTQQQRETASLLAAQAVVALDNARLHGIVERQAALDGLTGLGNRRRCEEALAHELALARRLELPCAFVMADLDDFKAINDRYGHPAGDVVLREFAVALRRSIRETDQAARWGGEEFAIVLPGADVEGAMRFAERVRTAFENRTILSPEGARLTVTASFGVAAYPDVPTAEELVAAADVALYQAKRRGKNRVVPAREAPAVRSFE